MRRKILSVMLIIGLIISIAGCGASKEEKKAVSKDIEITQSETAENKDADIGESVEITPENEANRENVDSGVEYEEQKDIFVCKHIDIGDGTEIDFTNEEIIDGPFLFTESIDIYSFFFTYAGYTKPDIKVNAVGKIGEWISVPFAKSSFLVKAEDFDRVAVLEVKKEMEPVENSTDVEMESVSTSKSSEIDAHAEGGANSGNEAIPESETVSQTEVATPAVTTYSEEEVISIVEGALRDAGFRKPEEDMTADELAMFGPTAGMGWGIDNIPLDDPYTAASQIVEGFQFAGWTTYYIESQGSSDGYVHLKLYSGS